MLSGVDERIEKVPRHVCLALNNGLISDIAASRIAANIAKLPGLIEQERRPPNGDLLS
jgi:hypothetical protein